MSVKAGLLALLAQSPMYGAQLRAEFERRTGGTWPLNVGQVYTTLGRLERDGLVESAGEPDAEGRIAYRLTEAGRAQVQAWWTTPVDRQDTPRDELVIKLALAVSLPWMDVTDLVRRQRTATLGHLQDLTRLKRTTAREAAEQGTDPQALLSWQLVLDNLIFADEAEVRWLDHVESTLNQVNDTTRTPGARPAGPDSPLASIPQETGR